VGASRRAKDLLRRTGLADDREADGIGRVFRAAALTYIVGVSRQLVFFLALSAVAEAVFRPSQ
jgi:Zn-dependent membrane protease YugP